MWFLQRLFRVATAKRWFQSLQFLVWFSLAYFDKLCFVAVYLFGSWAITFRCCCYLCLSAVSAKNSEVIGVQATFAVRQTIISMPGSY